MKNIFYSLALLAIIPMAISSCSDDDDDENNSTLSCDSLKYTIISDGEVAVIGYNDSNNGTVDGRSATSLVIPSQVSINGKNYRVTSIATSAFEYCPRLTNLTIPSSVITIGEKAFAECNSLTKVTIPSSVDSIYGSAFKGCTKADVIIDSDPNVIPYVDSTAFVDAHSLSLTENAMNGLVSGKIGEYAYVDLGLPSGLKWASYNVGASSILQYGDYVDWAEKDSVASKWGAAWRVPTGSELEELVDGCYWQWVDGFFGASGQLGTSKTNGKQIFLPAAGYMKNDSTLTDKNINGCYWSSDEYIDSYTGSSYHMWDMPHTWYYYYYLQLKSEDESGKLPSITSYWNFTFPSSIRTVSE